MLELTCEFYSNSARVLVLTYEFLRANYRLILRLIEMHYLDKKAPKILTEGTYYQTPLKGEKKNRNKK